MSEKIVKKINKKDKISAVDQNLKVIKRRRQKVFMHEINKTISALEVYVDFENSTVNNNLYTEIMLIKDTMSNLYKTYLNMANGLADCYTELLQDCLINNDKIQVEIGGYEDPDNVISIYRKRNNKTVYSFDENNFKHQIFKYHPPEDKIFNSTKQITILGYVPLYYKEMLKLKRKLDNLSTDATAIAVR